MGYVMDNGRYADTQELVLDSAKSVSGASGNGTVTEVGDRGTARLTLDVTALGAGTTLTVTVKTCETSDGTYRTVLAFTPNTATGTERLSFTGLDRFVKADWALSAGTTTATYSVTGEAV